MRFEKSDEEYLLMAYKAATQSPDPSTQNGAVIPYSLLGRERYHSACNTFPKNVKNKPERLERPLKYNYVEHAERNVIFEAAAMGTFGCVNNLTMFVPWFACADCARAIIQVGIRRVVGHKPMMDKTPDHWKESIQHALTMLEEAGVETKLVTTILNGPEIRFNGELWRP
jgi:dCMP deaminase